MLYLIDTNSRQLAVYEARGGSAGNRRVVLVGARRIDLDDDEIDAEVLDSMAVSQDHYRLALGASNAAHAAAKRQSELEAHVAALEELVRRS